MAGIERGSLSAAALIVVMLLLGALSGIALDRWVLRPDEPAAAMHDMRMAPGRFDPCAEMTPATVGGAARLALPPTVGAGLAARVASASFAASSSSLAVTSVGGIWGRVMPPSVRVCGGGSR